MRTYGAIVYAKADRTWRLRCEPQVALKLKRLFGKVSRGAQGTISLTDTLETARDLAWFEKRYPMVMSARDRQYLLVSESQHRALNEDIGRILRSDYQPSVATLRIPPRQYQCVAINLAEKTRGTLIADDVGLGKTVVGIGLLANPAARPALVVTLTHLPRQWQSEIQKFLPGAKVHILAKGTPYEMDIPDVIVSNYHKLSGWAGELAGKVRSVIFDEVQELRHHDSFKYSAAAVVAERARYRLGLSATPIHNYGGEIFNVLNVLRPGALGEWSEFATEWCGGGGDRKKATIDDPKAFGAYAKEAGLMLRRTRADVGRELPGLTVVPHTIEADTSVMDGIKGEAAELAKVILAQGGKPITKLRAAEEFSWRLRQATGIAKCMAPGTRLLRSDGSIELIENVKPGDLLMGPDGNPRMVMRTVSGSGPMFEVSSTQKCPAFEPYVVNGDHILALKHTGAVRHGNRFLFGPYLRGDHVEISVSDYMGKSKSFRRLLKGYKTGVEFPQRSLELDPYFLGLWLGDGSSDSASITTADKEIVAYLKELAGSKGLFIRVKHEGRTAPIYCLTPRKRGGNARTAIFRNPVRAALKELGVLGNKHIPFEYLTASRSQRMKLLAGLIDADGHLDCPGVYTIVSKWKHLADEICRLAWSLGFAAKAKNVIVRNQSKKTFSVWRVCLSGNETNQLPMLIERKRTEPRRQIKDPLRSGIVVRPIGNGPYCGFELDGDGLYLLRDFTVTHNSPFVADFVRMLVESGEPVLLAGWHHEVYRLWQDRLSDLNPVMFTGTESPTQKEEAKKAFVEGKSKVLVMSLRAGAGIDGLQNVCKTVVFGELDWSPSVHEQFTGRVYRDGQKDPVFAYYLTADSGSDPVIADILGVKRGQLEGIRDPKGALVVPNQTDPERMKKLAADYLRRVGGNT